jgi:MOSC domain-containing protein YiiM
MGQVSHLFLSSGSRRPMREVESAVALADRGLEGCRHGRAGSRRQVLVMDSETLESFRLRPGQIKENITTRGMRVNDLSTGQRLEIGQAMLEVTGPCEPCSRMDEIRMGLQQELQEKRGILCCVIASGRIQRGDTIQLATATGAGCTCSPQRNNVAASQNGGQL